MFQLHFRPNVRRKTRLCARPRALHLPHFGDCPFRQQSHGRAPHSHAASPSDDRQGLRESRPVPPAQQNGPLLEYAASKDGFINSNYGHLIYSSDYHNQYDRVLDELIMAPDGRRAMMIYNRPQIWNEYNIDGCNDFICTNSVAYYIRNGELHCSVSMRSNDVAYGYKNDYAWQQFVLHELANDLDVEPGDMIWQVQNLHVYEKHFDLIKPGPLPGPKPELSTAAAYEGYDNRNYG